MTNTVLVGIIVVLLLVTLVHNTVQAVLERKTARQFLEALSLVRPVMEDMRRIEPHLDETLELGLISLTESQEKMRRIANGHVTPFGLVWARRKRT